MSDSNLISQYDYVLPDELIAQKPLENRENSRLLVIDRQQGSIRHHHFRDLPELLRPDDLLVVNNTRVVPARLMGHRVATGGKWEGLFLRCEADGRWRMIGQTRGRLQAGERIALKPCDPDASDSNCQVEVQLDEKNEDGTWLCRPLSNTPSLQLLDQFGTLPLPHYMHRQAEMSDRERYQTTYAQRPGAVAAPTAGLHFTPKLLQQCEARGIGSTHVTLHVGLGTFRPVSAEVLSDHKMHSEWCEIPPETVQRIETTRRAGGRIIAVGTTSVRPLESVTRDGPLRPWEGETNLFIRPPFEFRVIDALITNFHLPRSTLLVLVCTFAGRELMLQAYAEAIRERYRFYSYGDAMLIL